MLSPTVTGMQNGLNFVSVFKLLKKLLTSSDPQLPAVSLSKALRTVYEDEFFTQDLGLVLAEIEPFLVYCDQHIPASDLLRKENEFELIEFLVTNAETFKKQSR